MNQHIRAYLLKHTLIFIRAESKQDSESKIPEFYVCRKTFTKKMINSTEIYIENIRHCYEILNGQIFHLIPEVVF